MKLWHLPLAMLHLVGVMAVVGLFVCAALALEAVLSVAILILIAGFLLTVVPILFVAEYRKRHAASGRV